MNRKIFLLFFAITLLFGSAVADARDRQKGKSKEKTTKSTKVTEPKEKAVPVKVDSTKVSLNEVLPQLDSIDILDLKLKLHKKGAHASYYHNKFNGRRTASGKKFDNNGYTAAHKKLPFGTKVKVTNEANGKFVIVEITDRGPFSKAREIDLSRKAFMDIASNKNSGMVIVTIEVIEPKK